MTETQGDSESVQNNHNQTFGEIREKYARKRKEADEILSLAGIDTNSLAGKKARRLTAKRFYRIEEAADTDKLTNILNRRGFERRYRDLAKIAERDGDDLVVVMADLNRLKETNDTKGHKAGDKLLIKTATLLRERIRETDVVARYGGDEFVFLFRKIGIEEVKKLWEERVAPALNENHISLSAGAAVVDTDDIHGSLEHADHKSYAAKKEYRAGGPGNNLVTHFS
ncbi:GGDEF domain-containing protein [Patescibacteria group bacterium]|nr:GGDEF domain-containing protein [Patescibacteria group bacterium]